MDRSQTWMVRGVIGVAIGLAVLITQVTVILVAFDHRATEASSSPQVSPAVLAPASEDVPTPTTRPSRSPVQKVDATPVVGGPGLDEPGIYVQYTARADGGFDAVERIMQDTTATEIVFTPPSAAGAGPDFAGLHPAVSGLTVDLGARRLLGSVPTRLAKTIARPMLTGTTKTTLAIHYRVTGTTVPSAGNTSRSLLKPLLAASDPALTVQIHMAGTGSTAITCPQLPVAERACGHGSPPLLDAGPGLTATSAAVVVETDRH